MEKININVNDLTETVKQSVLRIIKESMTKWFVVDDGGVYNVFPEEDLEQYGIEKDQIVKVFYDMNKAFDYSEKLNRQAEESSPYFSPSRGYYGESKSKKGFNLTESKLKSMITECIQEVLTEEEILMDDDDSMSKTINEFDNISNEDLAKFNENYYSVIVPEWALPALVNGDYEGLTDDEIMDVQSFEKHFVPGGDCELYNGLTAGDLCIPMEGTSPSFCPKNDVGGLATMCYKFAFPAK